MNNQDEENEDQDHVKEIQDNETAQDTKYKMQYLTWWIGTILISFQEDLQRFLEAAKEWEIKGLTGDV